MLQLYKSASQFSNLNRFPSPQAVPVWVYGKFDFFLLKLWEKRDYPPPRLDEVLLLIPSCHMLDREVDKIIATWIVLWRQLTYAQRHHHCHKISLYSGKSFPHYFRKWKMHMCFIWSFSSIPFICDLKLQGSFFSVSYPFHIYICYYTFYIEFSRSVEWWEPVLFQSKSI